MSKEPVRSALETRAERPMVGTLSGEIRGVMEAGAGSAVNVGEEGGVCSWDGTKGMGWRHKPWDWFVGGMVGWRKGENLRLAPLPGLSLAGLVRPPYWEVGAGGASIWRDSGRGEGVVGGVQVPGERRTEWLVTGRNWAPVMRCSCSARRQQAHRRC
jgi:hypothetical protein